MQLINIFMNQLQVNLYRLGSMDPDHTDLKFRIWRYYLASIPGTAARWTSWARNKMNLS